MEPSEYFAALRKRWLTVVVMTLLGALAATGYLATTHPEYRAATKVFLSVGEGKSVGELVQGSNYAQNVVQTYADLATTPVVLDPVIARLGMATTPEALGGRVSADVVLNTVIIEISATDSTPAGAADIANAVAQELSHSVRDLAPKNLASAVGLRITAVAPAKPPTAPAWPNRKVLLALGLAVGLTLGVAIAILRERLDTRIRTPQAVAKHISLPLLGSVHVSRTDPVQSLHQHGEKADAFRTIDHNVAFFMQGRGRGVLVVTGLRPGTATTVTAVDFAVTLSEAHRRVALLDAELLHPSVAEYMGLPTGHGLSRVLSGQSSVGESFESWDDGLLRVLPSGPVPPNPDELLASEAFAALRAEVRRTADVVVVHAPLAALPLIGIDDPSCVGVVLVVERRARRAAVRQAVTDVEGAGGRVLGVVLAKVSGRRELASGPAAAASSAPWWRATSRRAAHQRDASAGRSTPVTAAGAPAEAGAAAAAGPAPAASATPPAPAPAGTTSAGTTPAGATSAGAAGATPARAVPAEPAPAGGARPVQGVPAGPGAQGPRPAPVPVAGARPAVAAPPTVPMSTAAFGAARPTSNGGSNGAPHGPSNGASNGAADGASKGTPNGAVKGSPAPADHEERLPASPLPASPLPAPPQGPATAGPVRPAVTSLFHRPADLRGAGGSQQPPAGQSPPPETEVDGEGEGETAGGAAEVPALSTGAAGRGAAAPDRGAPGSRS